MGDLLRNRFNENLVDVGNKTLGPSNQMITIFVIRAYQGRIKVYLYRDRSCDMQSTIIL